MPAEIEEALKRAHVFSRLGDEDRRRLAEVARSTSTSAGRRVFTEGDPPTTSARW